MNSTGTTRCTVHDVTRPLFLAYWGLSYVTIFINIILTTDEGHLCDICSELAPVRANYYQLGVQLGLPAGDLEAIKMQNSHNLDQAFSDMILRWLNQLYDVDRHGLPTWRRLLAAVSSPCGGKNPALAKRTAAKIPGIHE